MKRKLNSLELFFYFFVWITANFYSLSKLYEAQYEILNENSTLLQYLNDLQPGWNFLSRLKDVSDIEWASWKYYIQVSWYYLMLQFAVSEFIRNKIYKQNVLKYWYILSSMILIILSMGMKQLMIVMVQPMLFFLILFMGGKKLTVWITSVLLLLSYNSLKYKNFFWNFLDHEEIRDEEVYLALLTVAWIELRCISYSIDYIDSSKKIQHFKDQEVSTTFLNNKLSYQNLIDMLSYVLYLPLLYSGPVVLYEDFERCFETKREKLSLRLKGFVMDILIFITYTFLLELAFHYIYFFAMQNNMELIEKLPTLALCGGGLWMGLEFHMKYVISYGVAAAFARMDHIEPPPTPRCIARIHVYSQMWRYFDVGLYRFLLKYIYIPGFTFVSGNGKLSITSCKLIASLGTFVFIFMWHGTIWDIFVWSTLNYIGITLEHLGTALSESDQYEWFKRRVLKSDRMETRFVALICVPLLTLSAISNFYLFAGSKVGNLFFKCFLQPSLKNSVIVGMSLYSCCQVSMALEDMPSRTDVKQSKLR